MQRSLFFIFFTLRKDQLGAEVDEIGHPACISCQQPTVAAVNSSEVTVGQHQPPDRIQRLFTTCLREMETKRGGRCALEGEFCHVTRSKQYFAATGSIPSYLCKSSLGVVLSFSRWEVSLKPNAGHRKPSVCTQASPALLAAAPVCFVRFSTPNSQSPKCYSTEEMVLGCPSSHSNIKSCGDLECRKAGGGPTTYRYCYLAYSLLWEMFPKAARSLFSKVATALWSSLLTSDGILAFYFLFFCHMRYFYPTSPWCLFVLYRWWCALSTFGNTTWLALCPWRKEHLQRYLASQPAPAACAALCSARWLEPAEDPVVHLALCCKMKFSCVLWCSWWRCFVFLKTLRKPWLIYVLARLLIDSRRNSDWMYLLLSILAPHRNPCLQRLVSF